MQISRRVLFPTENSANPFSRKVFTDISNLLRGSNIRWRGRSFAATVPSDISKGVKSRKRVSKDVRKAMVESFVNEYRAMNAGKFPTVSHARKQVGGSYYVLRQILQEIEYKSRTSSKNKRIDHLSVKEIAKENELLTEIEEVSSAQVAVNAGVHEDSCSVSVSDVDIGDSSVKHFELKEGLQASIVVERLSSKKDLKPKTADNYSNYVSHQSHLQKSKADENSEDDVKEKISGDMLDFHGLKPTAEERQQSTESDKLEGDLSEKQKNDEQLPTKSSMWGNLKSFADGFMNMWRKL